MRPQRAIICAKGFREARKYAESCGIDLICDAVEDTFHNRRDVYVARCTWDDDPGDVVTDILRHGIKVIDVVAYSWGNGKYGMGLADLLAKYRLTIRRYLAIDPVPYVFARWFSQACIPTASPFELPDIVESYGVWRTVNWRGIFDPWGRHVVGRGKCLKRVVIGTQQNLANPKYVAIGTPIVDEGKTIHTNIDEHPIVRKQVLELLQEQLP